MAEKKRKVHWVDNPRSNIRLWWTFCGLYSSSLILPHLMTFKKAEVTCKNCLRGARK